MEFAVSPDQRDLIDVHSYGEVDEMHKNPVFATLFVDWMAAARVVDPCFKRA
jgi:hypothetical protein